MSKNLVTKSDHIFKNFAKQTLQYRGIAKGGPGWAFALPSEYTMKNRLWVVIFEKDCGIQKSQLLWQLTTVGGLECRGR